MAFEQWDKHMICDGGLKNLTAGDFTYGYEFALQYPTYRGTYLSCIEQIDVEVNDLPICREDILFVLNNKEFLLSELSGLFREYWFILDHALLRVVNNRGLAKGSTQKIKVIMKHRIPYTGYFGGYMVPVSKCTKMLKVN